MDKYDLYDRYEAYTYTEDSRRAHRNRRGKNPTKDARRYRKQKEHRMAEMSDRVDQFVPTYVRNLDPLHHERQWVINSLSSFFGNNQISDVLRLVKGGKEANVYFCQANPRTGLEWIAAKLYRPRMLRHLKNNALYKEGRFLRDQDGKLLLGSREARAMANKTRFGKDLDLANWIGHEFEMQTVLYEQGADVPQPVAHGGNAILMAYLGEPAMPAPLLQEVSLLPEEVEPLFQRLLWNVELMLRNHLIHGDFSAYNILYWQGKVSIIDFPQMIDARTNGNAYELLERDVQRLADYFTGYEMSINATALAADLWHRYMNAQL